MGAVGGAGVMQRSSIAIDELMRQLESDREWIALRDVKDRERAKRTRELRDEQSSLIEELRGVGVDVDDVWRLLRMSQPYPDAVPILLRHLFLPYADRTREGIGRALAVKEARPLAWDRLLAALETGVLVGGAAEGAIIALSAMARPADLPVVCKLIRNRAVGPCRVFLVRILTRSKQPEAKETLLALESDPDLGVEINRWLKNRKDQEIK